MHNVSFVRLKIKYQDLTLINDSKLILRTLCEVVLVIDLAGFPTLQTSASYLARRRRLKSVFIFLIASGLSVINEFLRLYQDLLA